MWISVFDLMSDRKLIRPGAGVMPLDIGYWYLAEVSRVFIIGGGGRPRDSSGCRGGWGRNLVIHFTDTFVSVHTLPLEEDRFFQARVKASSRNPCK